MSRLNEILIIDNYDSFTFNLEQYVGSLGSRPKAIRNDRTTIQEIEADMPDGIIISPGPGVPATAGISKAVIKHFHSKIPILGVCLGHQSIGEVFGGTVKRATEIRHGKTSPIIHKGEGVFEDLEKPFLATRYHSLIVERESLPDALHVTAWAEDKSIMGLQVKDSKTFGVQFHPESYATESGMKIMENFICCLN